MDLKQLWWEDVELNLGADLDNFKLTVGLGCVPIYFLKPETGVDSRYLVRRQSVQV